MAENTENVFGINFDSSKFISNIETAIDALKKFEGQGDQFEQAMKVLSAQVNSVSFSKPISEVDKLRNAFAKFKAEGGKIDLSQFDAAVNEMMKDLPKLEKFVADLKKEMEGIDNSSEGFAELDGYVKKLEKSISDLKNETTETDNNGFVPLKKRLKELKLAMQEMEDAGQETTEEYRKMRIEAAQLTDQLGDQSEAIRVLASDTFALDAAVDGLQTVTAGFQLFEGAMALAGAENEDMQKSMQKLMALMNIANGLQQLHNFLTGQSAAKLALQSFWTKAQAIATRLTAVATVQATAATRAWSAALAATGVGALVVGLGLLVSALWDWIDTSEEAKEAQDRLNASIESQNEILDLDLAAVQRRNKLKIAQMKKDGKSEEDIRAATIKGMEDELYMVKWTQSDLQKLRKQAQKDKISTVDLDKKLSEIEQDILERENDIKVAGLEAEADANKKSADLKKKRNDDAKRAGEELVKLTEQYEKKVIEVRNKTLDLQASDAPKTDKSIRDRLEREAQVEIDETKKTYAKLGPAKVNALVKQIKEFYKLQGDLEINGFKEEQAEAKKELLRSLEDSQRQLTNERIALIDDDYERTNAEIAQQEKERKDEIIRQREDYEKEIADKVKKGLLTQPEATDALAKNEEITQKRLLLVEEEGRKKRLDAVRAFYENLLSIAKEYAERQNSEQAKIVSEQILAQSELLNKGEINWTQYQKRLAKIQEDANKQELLNQIKQGEERLRLLRQALEKETDARKKVLLEAQIAETEAGINQAKTSVNTIGKQLEGFDSILGKIFGTTDQGEITQLKASLNKAIQSTIDLVRQGTQAEIEAADKAIAAQQRRVDEAKKIAEEGNAEYLRQEEERLRELEIKREQAARKQLQLDAAVQASQILVAVAGAAADAFKKGTGPAGVAAGIAAILAAIASGAALVKSLQNNQPRFFEGTDYVRRGNNPVGRDTIPAMLHEGEAVISAKTNERYSPTIRAIRRGLMPENVLNGFVKDYTNGIRYDKIGKAVEARDSGNKYFSEMNERLGRLESVMSLTAEAIQGLGVNVRLDQDGFAASINTHLSRRNKILKA